jgi:hypothetical protein
MTGASELLRYVGGALHWSKGTVLHNRPLSMIDRICSVP